jgi:RND superfamily putative drug exporter
LTVPFFSIRLGQADAGNDPKGTDTRVAYDTLVQGFGPGFNGPLEVAVDVGPGGDPTAAQAKVQAITRALRNTPGVAAALAQPGLNTAGDTALITAYPTTAPQAAATQHLVHSLRDTVLPGVERSTGVKRILVTGSTAAIVDISDKVQSSLPLFIGAVIGLSILLLMVVFRSILVPLKAAAMNLLGIGAAYGVVVAIFQWGWAKQLFGVSETVPIIAFLPMFMFAILFGLSMDYEVFLMSRIREEYVRTGDNLAAVSRGIDTTARVITAAAIIMVSVFCSFCFGADPTVKMMGLGLAVAIFLDATLIRMVLVPATMALLGNANWWVPRWLDRWLPHLDLESERDLPVPEMDPRLPSTALPVGSRSRISEAASEVTEATDVVGAPDDDLVGAGR